MFVFYKVVKIVWSSLFCRNHAVRVLQGHGVQREYDGRLHVPLGRGSQGDLWPPGGDACRYVWCLFNTSHWQCCRESLYITSVIYFTSSPKTDARFCLLNIKLMFWRHIYRVCPQTVVIRPILARVSPPFMSVQEGSSVSATLRGRAASASWEREYIFVSTRGRHFPDDRNTS